MSSPDEPSHRAVRRFSDPRNPGLEGRMTVCAIGDMSKVKPQRVAVARVPGTGAVARQ
jgi:hypothetical protein